MKQQNTVKGLIALFGLLGVCAAQAASIIDTDVQFNGRVTALTCELLPEFGGAVDTTIQLGTVGVGEEGDKVSFALKADTSDPACATLAEQAAVEIEWSSGTGIFTAAGLSTPSSEASDAIIVIASMPLGALGAEVNTTNNLSSFTGADIFAEGARFTAALHAGQVPGDVIATAMYSVVYK